MSYEAWRISFQSGEGAARAAWHECQRLRGEQGVLMGLLAECAAVLKTIEAESSEEGDSLRVLLDAIERARSPEARAGTLL